MRDPAESRADRDLRRERRRLARVESLARSWSRWLSREWPLGEPHWRALAVVVAGRDASSERDAVCSACGADCVAELEAAGWLRTWRDGGGPLVTLTPDAADRLCVELWQRRELSPVRWVGGRLGAKGSVWGEWGRMSDGRPIIAVKHAGEARLGAREHTIPDKRPDTNRDFYTETVPEVAVEGGREVVKMVERTLVLLGVPVLKDDKLRGKGRKAG